MLIVARHGPRVWFACGTVYRRWPWLEDGTIQPWAACYGMKLSYHRRRCDAKLAVELYETGGAAAKEPYFRHPRRVRQGDM